VRRIVLAVLIGTAVGTALSGCGWLRAGNVSHTKPSGFVLRGYVTVAGAPSGTAGSPCQMQSLGVAANDPVLVTDPPGRTLATGVLGAGVLAPDSPGGPGGPGGNVYRCNFPFEIPGVAGGHNSYEISIAGRPAVSFPATELRQDKPAVITVP
jgi:hypothetical protein